MHCVIMGLWYAVTSGKSLGPRRLQRYRPWLSTLARGDLNLIQLRQSKKVIHEHQDKDRGCQDGRQPSTLSAED